MQTVRVYISPDYRAILRAASSRYCNFNEERG